MKYDEEVKYDVRVTRRLLCMRRKRVHLHAWLRWLQRHLAGGCWKRAAKVLGP